MRVLVACEFSGRVRDAFIREGHQAWSCDLLPTETPGPHYQERIEDVLTSGLQWDLMIAHPPCTYLTNAGVRHLHPDNVTAEGRRTKLNGLERWQAMLEACEFFNLLLKADVPRICVENPIPHCYARAETGPYTQIIQPWMFGHEETKATCLWLRGLPELEPTDVVGPPPREMTMELKRKWNRVHRARRRPDRWKVRSRTLEGIAMAMAEQWGGLRV